MAKTYEVQVEQLIRQTLSVNIEADSEEEALAHAIDSQNWGEWDQDGEEDVVENRPVSALPVDPVVA